MSQSQFTIHCIGDSHASFFSGTDAIQPVWPELGKNYIPLFKAYRLGPVTAYNLCKTGTKSGGREKLFEVLKTIETNSTVLLSFGEIDCRVHLLKQSREHDRPLADVVNECVDRYFGVVQEVKSLGYQVLVWAAIPSTIAGKIAEPDYVAYGTCAERNEVTKLFNNRLTQLAEAQKIPVISVFNELVLPNGLTNFAYYSDEVHLSQKAMPLVVRKIKALFPNAELRLVPSPTAHTFTWGAQMHLFTFISYLRATRFKFSTYIIMLKQFIMRFINKSPKLVEWKARLDWYRAGRPVPPPHSIKELTIQKYARRYGTRVFIESGTFMGDMVAAMLPRFDRLFSIELSAELAAKAQARFANEAKVSIVQGDSGVVLFEVLKEVDVPALFWLDGHYSAGITAKADLNTPIHNELKAILEHPIKNHVILIDDARLFVGKDDYPTLDELKKFIAGYNSALCVTVEADSICIFANV